MGERGDPGAPVGVGLLVPQWRGAAGCCPQGREEVTRRRRLPAPSPPPSPSASSLFLSLLLSLCFPRSVSSSPVAYFYFSLLTGYVRARSQTLSLGGLCTALVTKELTLTGLCAVEGGRAGAQDAQRFLPQDLCTSHGFHLPPSSCGCPAGAPSHPLGVTSDVP